MKTISDLNSEDLTQAFQIEQLCHSHPWSEAVFNSNQGQHYLNLKIESQQQIIGFCICHIVADEASLFNIAIHPQFQKQGYAKILLNALIDKLMAIKKPIPINQIWLEVRQSNLTAIKLYQTLGFNEIMIRKNYYPKSEGTFEDAIIMAYSLSL